MIKTRYKDGKLYRLFYFTITTPGDFFDVSFDKLIEVCCRGNSNLSVQAVPSVLTGATAPGTATETEPPILQNANFFVIKKA